MTERSPGATTIVDTTELRWFADGPLPAEVVSWFAGLASTTGMIPGSSAGFEGSWS